MHSVYSTEIETVSSFALIQKCCSSAPCIISPPIHRRCLRVLPTRRQPPWSSDMKIFVARARTFGLARAEAVRSLGSKRGPSATIFTCTLSSGKKTNFDGNCLHSLNTKTSNIIQHTKHLLAGEQGMRATTTYHRDAKKKAHDSFRSSASARNNYGVIRVEDAREHHPSGIFPPTDLCPPVSPPAWGAQPPHARSQLLKQ